MRLEMLLGAGEEGIAVDIEPLEARRFAHRRPSASCQGLVHSHGSASAKSGPGFPPRTMHPFKNEHRLNPKRANPFWVRCLRTEQEHRLGSESRAESVDNGE